MCGCWLSGVAGVTAAHLELQAQAAAGLFGWLAGWLSVWLSGLA